MRLVPALARFLLLMTQYHRPGEVYRGLFWFTVLARDEEAESPHSLLAGRVLTQLGATHDSKSTCLGLSTGLSYKATRIQSWGVGGLILNVLSNPNHTPKCSISLQCGEIKFPPSQGLTAGIKLQSELQ